MLLEHLRLFFSVLWDWQYLPRFLDLNVLNVEDQYREELESVLIAGRYWSGKDEETSF